MIFFKMPHLTYNQKKSILDDISNNMSYRSIGDKYGISHTTVSRLFKKFSKDGQKSLLSESGRKKKLHCHEILRMKRICNAKPFFSGRQVRDEAMLNTEISIPTANRYLRSFGLLGRIAKRLNYHSRKHMTRRRNFCKIVQQWDISRWHKVVFTDEVRIEMESQRRVFVRRPVGLRNKARYCIKWKYSDRRSIMFWGLICADGRRELVSCAGNMDSVQYCSILQKYYVTRYMNKILQQDNATCHCSTVTKNFIRSRKIALLQDYPPCSPDLNIIENIWAILKNKVRRRAARSLEELRTIVEEEFHQIPDSVITNLYLSIPKRISEVIRRRGSS